jgi:hypothetical protein
MTPCWKATFGRIGTMFGQLALWPNVFKNSRTCLM